MFYRFGVLLVVISYVSMTYALPPCVCTRERRPVCGSDGQTYSNKCLLDCQRSKNQNDLKIEKMGPCEPEPPVCFCTYEYKPVCGSNGVTYPNECALRCEGDLVRLEYSGECRPKREIEKVSVVELPACLCTRQANFVCGTDGHTYSNPCMLNCAREEQRKKDLHIDHPGMCTDEVKVVEEAVNESCTCAKNLEPVCASNGVTFGNMCLLGCAGSDLTVAHHGPCEEST